jgi:PAS domain S-box-containing protein
MVRVVPERSPSTDSLLLTLHHVAAGLVIGVLTGGADGEVGAECAVHALRGVWDGLAEGVAIATLDAGGRLGGIVRCNGAFATMFGESTEDMVGQPLARFLAPLRGAAFDDRVAEDVVREGRRVSDLTTAGCGKGAKSDERGPQNWELSPMRAHDGRVVGAIAVVRDASRAKPAPTGKRTDLDPSSGLPNEVHFLSRLERSVERAGQTRAYTFAVIAVEMRGLRALERRLGPRVANTALEALVRRVEQRLRPTDLVARTGDRRLAVLLDHFAPWGSLEEVVDRIRAVADEPYTIGGERMTMSAVGAPGPIWSADGPRVEAHDVLGRLDAAVADAKADAAMSRVRKSGRTNGEASELTAAVKRAQLGLRYLPLVAREDGRVVGMEALVHWARPRHGVVPGAAFLQDAEQRGLIRAVGGWVWSEVLRHIRDWDASLAPGQVAPVHINLSLSEFWNPGLPDELERRAAEAVVAPSRIRLEIPEAAVARRTAAAIGVVEALRGAGFDLWLDRFGEGGTPLAALESLPFRHAKLTPTTAWSPNGNAHRPRGLLRSLVALGHALGWRMAVGGVERREHAEALRPTRCDIVQGFFYHGLLTYTEAAALMRQSPRTEAPISPH